MLLLRVIVPVFRKEQQNKGRSPSRLPHTTVSPFPLPNIFCCCRSVSEKIKRSSSFSEYQAERRPLERSSLHW